MTRVRYSSGSARVSDRYAMPDYDRPPSPVVSSHERSTRRASTPASFHFFDVRASDFVAIPLTGRERSSNPIVLGPLENAARPISCNIPSQRGSEQISAKNVTKRNGNQGMSEMTTMPTSPLIRGDNYCLVKDTMHADVLSDIVLAAERSRKSCSRTSITSRPPKQQCHSGASTTHDVSFAGSKRNANMCPKEDSSVEASSRPDPGPVSGVNSKSLSSDEAGAPYNVGLQQHAHTRTSVEHLPVSNANPLGQTNHRTIVPEKRDIGLENSENNYPGQPVQSAAKQQASMERKFSAADMYDLDNWSDAVDTVGTESITTGIWPNPESPHSARSVSTHSRRTSAGSENAASSHNKLPNNLSNSSSHSSLKNGCTRPEVPIPAAGYRAPESSAPINSTMSTPTSTQGAQYRGEEEENHQSMLHRRNVDNLASEPKTPKHASSTEEDKFVKNDFNDTHLTIVSVTSVASSLVKAQSSNSETFEGESVASSAYATADDGIYSSYISGGWRSASESSIRRQSSFKRVVRVSGQLGGFTLSDDEDNDRSCTATNSSVDFKYQDASEEESDSEFAQAEETKASDENMATKLMPDICALKLPQTDGERHSVGDHLPGLAVRSPALSSLSRDENSNMSISSHSSKHRFNRSGKRFSDESEDSRCSVPAEFYANDPYDVFCASRDSPLRPRRNSYINRLLTGQVHERPPSSSSASSG